MKNVTAEFYILVDGIANSIQQVSNINSQEYGLHFSREIYFALLLLFYSNLWFSKYELSLRFRKG